MVTWPTSRPTGEAAGSEADARDVVFDGLEYPQVCHTLQLQLSSGVLVGLVVGAWLRRQRRQRLALLLRAFPPPPLGAREPWRALGRVATGRAASAPNCLGRRGAELERHRRPITLLAEMQRLEAACRWTVSAAAVGAEAVHVPERKRGAPQGAAAGPELRHTEAQRTRKRSATALHCTSQQHLGASCAETQLATLVACSGRTRDRNGLYSTGGYTYM